jgi:hypothetical protein
MIGLYAMAVMHWKITGWDSAGWTYEKRLAAGLLSWRKAEEILKVLCAVKARLTEGEIIGAFQRRNGRLHNSLLDVTRDGPRALNCGCNPYFRVELVLGVIPNSAREI